jgi:hypothetical protein
MNWFLDYFGEADDLMVHAQCEKIARQDERSGPCEDDEEMTCPFVDMLPDESNHENGSPLRFAPLMGVSLDSPEFKASVQNALLMRNFMR